MRVYYEAATYVVSFRKLNMLLLPRGHLVDAHSIAELNPEYGQQGKHVLAICRSCKLDEIVCS
jgi:hypothetical protein